MGYLLHIEREEPISNKEWQEDVSSVLGIKLSGAAIEVSNPNTKEIISFSGNEGDVSVLFESKSYFGFRRNSSWEKCILFSNGRGTFKAGDDIESVKNPVHCAGAALAKKLSVEIVGDEGEVYFW